MLHLAPLVLILLVLTTMTKGTGQTLSKLLPIGKQAGLSIASFLCAVTIPALTGALRSGLSGEMRSLKPSLLYCGRRAWICGCTSRLVSRQLSVCSYHSCRDGCPRIRLVR